jgi:hypothetical protein
MKVLVTVAAGFKLGWTPRIASDELLAEMIRKNLCDSQCDELVSPPHYAPLDCRE